MKYSDIVPEEKEEQFQQKYMLAVAFLNNWKQSSSQTCHICPHIDSWQLDWYFSNAVLLGMIGPDTEDCGFVFPAYGKRAIKEDSRNKINSSGVSSLWTDKYKEMVEHFETVSDKIASLSDDLRCKTVALTHTFQTISSHAGKKYAVQAMGSTLKVVQIIFRAGWDVRNAHTLFDYLQREAVHDLEAAKGKRKLLLLYCLSIRG